MLKSSSDQLSKFLEASESKSWTPPTEPDLLQQYAFLLLIQGAYQPNRCLFAARNIKSPLELEVMRKAIAVSAKAHNLLLTAVKVGDFEYQLEAEFIYHCSKQGHALLRLVHT